MVTQMLLEIAEIVGRRKYSGGDVIIIQSGLNWKVAFESLDRPLNTARVAGLVKYPKLSLALLNVIYSELVTQ